MTTWDVLVVGAGPWGTYATERLAAVLRAGPPAVPFSIAVVDAVGSSAGGSTHHHEQATTSYLNRVASQVSFAADESNAAGPLLPPELRPTLAQWAHERFRWTGDERFAIGAQDVPRRYLHGLALAWAFEQYVGVLRSIAGVSVDLVDDEVVDLHDTADPDVVAVHFRSGARGKARRVLLVTGHSTNTPRPGSNEHRWQRHAQAHPATSTYISSAYPLRQQLDQPSVPPGSRTGVIGMGLTSIDLVLHLTEGRGGAFARSDGRLVYQRSGREPSLIVVVSASGTFTTARAHNEKATDASGRGHTHLQHRARFLTAENLAALRRAVGRENHLSTGAVNQLDWRRHVLPLLVLELAVAYYGCLLGAGFAEQAEVVIAEPLAAHLRGATSAGPGDDVDRLLAPLDGVLPAVLPCESTVTPVAGPDGRFYWRRWFDPCTYEGSEPWSSRLLAFMRADLRAAGEGNLSNAYKYAVDGVWRDQRSVLSGVLNFGGLTAASQRDFMLHHLRSYARMSNGAGPEAMAKLVALMEGGVVDASGGPGGTALTRPGGGWTMHGEASPGLDVDILVDGRTHLFDPLTDVRPLYRNLLGSGMVRQWRNPGLDGAPDFAPGALDITRDYHPFRRDGRVDKRLTVLGTPVEGVVFFHSAAARPHVGSNVLNTLGRWAQEAVAADRAGQLTVHAGRAPARPHAAVGLRPRPVAGPTRQEDQP